MANTVNAIVTISVRIHDQNALRDAATQRAIEEGMTLEDWLTVRTGPDSDLQMLLDPGSLAGCDIHNSQVEVLP